jgi:hypothetical protein
MAAVDDVDELIERYHLALGEFMKGNPKPAKRLWSRREDASLINPQGSVARGWTEIADAMDRAASTRRSGRFLGFETVAKRVTDELTYVVEVEHLQQVALILTSPQVYATTSEQTYPSARPHICIMRCGSCSLKLAVRGQSSRRAGDHALRSAGHHDL